MSHRWHPVAHRYTWRSPLPYCKVMLHIPTVEDAINHLFQESAELPSDFFYGMQRVWVPDMEMCRITKPNPCPPYRIHKIKEGSQALY